MTLLKIESLTIGYDKPIVKDISLCVKSPSMIQVVGPNGAGKTALLRTLIGVLKPFKGRIMVDEEDITGSPTKAGRVVSYVPQIATYILSDVFPITVWEFIEFEAISYAKQLGLSKSDIVRLVKEALTMVGIPEQLWHKGVNRLSGGQRQRLLIARALLKDVPIVAMDEPFSGIDIEGRIIITNIVNEIKKRGKIVIVTCHDPSMLMEYTDYIMLMANGAYVFGKPNEVLVPPILKKIYHNCFTEFGMHIHLYDHHL